MPSAYLEDKVLSVLNPQTSERAGKQFNLKPLAAMLASRSYRSAYRKAKAAP